MPRDARKDFVQITSLATIAMTLYYASAKDRDTIVCFLVFHNIADRARVTK